MEGVVLATGPSPVRNAELMATLRRVVGRRALPARLTAAGFGFTHPDLHATLRDLVR